MHVTFLKSSDKLFQIFDDEYNNFQVTYKDDISSFLVDNDITIIVLLCACKDLHN